MTFDRAKYHDCNVGDIYSSEKDGITVLVLSNTWGTGFQLNHWDQTVEVYFLEDRKDIFEEQKTTRIVLAAFSKLHFEKVMSE